MKKITFLLFVLFISCNYLLDQEEGIITTLPNVSKTDNSDLIQEVPDPSQKIKCDSLLNRLQKKQMDTIAIPNYQPKNFNECMAQLDTLINDSLKEWIRCLPDKEFGNAVHHSFGRHLRNHWELWGESELSTNLHNMGIFHPDDMSAIILNCYQRKIKGQYIKLKEQLKYYQDYWRKAEHPVDSLLEVIKKEQQGLHKLNNYYWL